MAWQQLKEWKPADTQKCSVEKILNTLFEKSRTIAQLQNAFLMCLKKKKRKDKYWATESTGDLISCHARSVSYFFYATTA